MKAQHRATVDGRRAAARLWLALLLALVPPGGSAASNEVYPRAVAAEAALQASKALDVVLAEPATAAFIHALGVPHSEETIAWLAGNAFSAVAANDIADNQWRRVADLARERDNDDRYGEALTRRADIALSSGDYALGEEIAAALLALAHRTGNSTYEAVAEENLGVIERRRGHLDVALTHQRHALELHRANNETSSAALALANLATLYRDRGDFAQALDSALESVALRERSGDHLEIAYRNVALLYREIEDTSTARTYFQRAIEIATHNGGPAAYAPVLGSYAGLLNDLGESDAARRAAAEALAIDEALGDRPHQGLEHLELGRAMVGQRAYDDARAEFDSALALGRSLGQHEIVANALLYKADLALVRHDTLHARGLLDEALAGVESSQLRTQLAHAYASREQLARAENNDADALRFAHKHAGVREELLGIRASRQLAALETRHSRAEAEQHLALLGKDNELQAALLEKQGLQRNIELGVLATLATLLALLIWRFVRVSRLNRALAARNGEIDRHRATLGQANLRLERQAIDLYQVAITDR